MYQLHIIRCDTITAFTLWRVNIIEALFTYSNISVVCRIRRLGTCTVYHHTLLTTCRTSDRHYHRRVVVLPGNLIVTHLIHLILIVTELLRSLAAGRSPAALHCQYWCLTAGCYTHQRNNLSDPTLNWTFSIILLLNDWRSSGWKKTVISEQTIELLGISVPCTIRAYRTEPHLKNSWLAIVWPVWTQ